MSRRSLRLRLLAASAVSIAAALILAGIGIAVLFARHVERRVDAELDTYVDQIAGNVAFLPGGALELLRPPADPRFNVPLSGLYWDVREIGGTRSIRSRSLWDETLRLPEDTLASAAVHRHLLAGPGGTTLIVRERRVLYPEGDLRIAVAIDRAEPRAAVRAFVSDLALSLVLLGAVLLAAAWAQVRYGLRPLEAVRSAIGAIRSGRRARLGGDHPDEVRPLAQEIDDLLDAQDESLARARSRAAELAHGLRTPLTVLATIAGRLRAEGRAQVADDIDHVAAGMRRHVESAITEARLGHRTAGPSPVAPLVGDVVATLRRTPDGARLTWTTGIPPGAVLAMDRDSLLDAIGNLAENGAKWARSRVHIALEIGEGTAVLAIEDDGPGIPPGDRERVTERWQRLDRDRSGSGLGLSIVRQIAEAHGGALRLGSSRLGGLRAELVLPETGAPPGGA